jgi:hypothetical protein
LNLKHVLFLSLFWMVRPVGNVKFATANI